MPDLRLGAAIDPAAHRRLDTPTTIPAEELTTHGVIVGMTGSGKTGLGVVLIEECLRSGIPALVIDPKGDLGNLALTFPHLGAAEFEPWVDSGAAAKAGLDVAAFAAAQAKSWTDGLADWGLGASDVAALRAAAPVTIYTPGAMFGAPLNILGSLDAPSDPDSVVEEADAYVGSLLSLLGIDADPLSSREHILLTNILSNAWTTGRALDLAGLVAAVQQPPFRKIGVLDLDAYYPPAERTKLAMRLNGLLASPSFAPWLQGPRIDIDGMLFAEGKPRCAVVTTAHLDDQERLSVTAVLLAKVISWMRRQPGTSALRVLLYLDEVAGYLPPVGNPPTKAPLLLLLKQARAFGVGVVLATQNPVDLDYKALGNAGTWMVGRLQTEQDKARLLDGLRSAAGTVDPRAADGTISGLGKREFLLRRVGRDALEVFTPRWAMSYLRGPMTRDEIERLQGAVPAPPPPVAEPVDDTTTPVAPQVPVPTYYLDPAASWAATVGAVPGTRLAPAAVARVRLRYTDTRAALVHDEEYEAVSFPIGAEFMPVDYDDRDLLPEPPQGAVYELPPSEVSNKAWWTAFRNRLVEDLLRQQTLQIPCNRVLKLYGRVGEGEQAFAERCRAAAQDAGDRAVATVASRYEQRINALQRRLDTATADLERKESARNSSLATDLIGGLFGRRTNVGTVARRMSTAQQRVGAAADRVADLSDQMVALRDEAQQQIDAIRSEWAEKAAAIETLTVTAKKTTTTVDSLALVWIPVG